MPGKERNSPAAIAFATLFAGVQISGIWAEEIATALSQAYCTPEICLALPQALTGWTLAVAPLLVSLWRRDAAIYLATFLAGLMGTLYLAVNDLWVPPLAFFLVGLVFVPISLGVSRLAKPGWRAVVVAGQHWLLLAGLILWLA